MNDGQVILDDGRRLAYREIGDPAGVPVLHFHGAPSCRNSLDYLHEEFAELGFRVISPDRPGYGNSSPQPDRTREDWPEDVAHLADALDIQQFVAIGVSSGGPYTVATCASLPNRVLGGIVVAGVTDPAIPGTVEGLPDVEQAAMAQPDTDAALAWCVDQFGEDGARFFDHDPFEWAEPDIEFLEDETKLEYIEQVAVEAFNQGIIGFAHDMAIQGVPWAFDTDRINAPVHVIHGTQDRILPTEHSRHTAELIPDASLILLENHGHASLTDEFPQFVAELIETAT